VLLSQPPHQIHQAPADNAMDRRHRTRLDDLKHCLPLLSIQDRALAGLLARDQPCRASRVEPQHPVPDRLQAGGADPSGFTAAAAVVDCSQRQQAAGLLRVARPSSQAAQPRCVVVLSKCHRRCHDDLHPVQQVATRPLPLGDPIVSQRYQDLALDIRAPAPGARQDARERRSSPHIP